MWTCPKCGARLVGRNMAHACGPWTVERFLQGKGVGASELFEAFAAAVRSIGPFDFAPAKTRVAFMVRVRFAAVLRVSNRGMTIGFWLKREVKSPKFSRVELIPPNNWIYQLRITDPEQLRDEELLGWLREAYAVGEQRHLRAPKDHAAEPASATKRPGSR
jgi:hypothetical protein